MLSRVPLTARGFAAAGRPSGGGGGEQIPLLAFMDWRTAPLGRTEEAVSDNGKATVFGQNPGGLYEADVIEAPGGLPCARIIRIHSRAEDTQGWVEPRLALPVHAENTTRNFRWIYTCTEPDGLTDGAQHPIQDGGAVGARSWSFNTLSTGNGLAAGEWGFYWDTASAQGPRWYLDTDALTTPSIIGLTKGLHYRFELQVVRLTGNDFRLHAWVHDMAGDLLYDDSDFFCPLNQGWAHEGLSLADSPVMSHTRWDTATVWFVPGLNGLLPDPYEYPVSHGDEGAFAIAGGLDEGEQIGAYGNGEGEVLP